MKIPLALSALILAIGASISWNDYQRLTVVRENHARAVAEAAALGIALDPAHQPATVRATQRERTGKEVTPKVFVAEIVAFFKDMEAKREMSQASPNAMSLGSDDLSERMKLLDPSQLTALIAELRSTQDLKEEYRAEVIFSALRQLADSQPQTALALLKDSPDLLKDKPWMRDNLVSSSLSKWATADPMAAFGWVREHAEKFPNFVTNRVKESMISGIGANNPKLALELVDKLGLGDTWQALCQIAQAADTPESRRVTLSALRDHLAASPGDAIRQELIGRFSGSVAEEGFASATEWFKRASLTPAELETVAGSLISSIKPEETGQWLEWIGKNLPAGKSESPIYGIVERWATSDYQAVGKWLSTAPASPAKNAAIRSYAQTVSTLDPATATQWAMTLPPGPDRDATLEHIQKHRPTK